ncbi:MAG: hypothetical protein LBK63_10255 [Treponema sp.]|nr:hypothetical protein [Treponema sp.]
MKRLAGIMAFLLAVNLGFLYGQETERKYSIKINPFMLLGDIIMGAGDQEFYSYSLSLEFQYAISNYWNIIARPNFLIRNSLPGYGGADAFFSGAHKYNQYYETEGTNIIFSVMPGILYRPFGTGFKGMYIGLYPNIGWENRKYEHKDSNSNIVNIDDNFFIAGIGVEAGYEWMFKNGFNITVGGGIERNWGIELGENKGEYEDPKSLYDIRIALFLGYSF